MVVRPRPGGFNCDPPDKPLTDAREARAASETPPSKTPQTFLVTHFKELREQLRRRLGSQEAADESLSETWLDLQDVAAVDNPPAYIMRTALNAADRSRKEARELPVADIEALRRLDHDELDPERQVASRWDVQVCMKALAELPQRCQSIFVESRVNGVTHAQLAERFRIDVRTVARDIEHAVAHCKSRLGEVPVKKTTGG